MSNDERAEKILKTLVNLWCDQNGLIPGKITITNPEKGKTA